ncbi:MAG TPA: hypothetical protein VG838_17815 [Opitutaceae bacterium]|nr:hypothetical protein [Opitutaceae bacterium]
MQLSILGLVLSVAGLMAGGAIGLAFGVLQAAALRRHEEQQQSGQLKNGWSLMPGAGVRVAYLLIALALVQLVCPLLFSNGIQWSVSGGVVAGYGWTLLQQLRRRLKASPR